MTRVSIRDVAAETGYSPATVSNVLNEKGNVGAKATNIILEAIARLGYSRSAQISRIIFAIAHVNGRIVDESTFQAGVYTGIERAARRLGLPSAMVTLDLPDPVTSRKNIAELEQNEGAGVVLLATEIVSDDQFSLLEEFSLPLVIVDSWSDKLPFDCVVTANETAAYRACTLLVEHGHEVIGYVGHVERCKNYPLREHGMRRVLDDMRFPFDENNRVLVDSAPEEAYRQLVDWLEQKRDSLPTAFFCESDSLAATVVHALRELGIDVPGDVSVVGFDDDRICKLIQPSLTSVHVPKHEMGEIAVKRLIDQTTDAHYAPCISQLHTTVVSRKSVKQL